MGCDIHMYIEHRTESTPNWWVGFGGQFHLSRNYQIFSHLAGVRLCDYRIKPIAANRGLPDNLSYSTRKDNNLDVIENYSECNCCCSVQDAEQWVSSGWSKWASTDKAGVTHPDWHSHSWCTADELEAAVLLSQTDGREVRPDWLVMITTLRALESHGYKVRAVFWFDN